MSNGDHSLPSSWALVPLQELLMPLEDGRLLHHGWSPQCEKGPSTTTSEWGVLKTTAVQDGKFLDEHNKRLPDHLSPRPQFEVKQGDVLITCAGPRARCGVVSLVRHTRPRLILSGKMYRFRLPEPMVDPRYLEGFLRSPDAQSAIDQMKTGISDSGLNLTHSRFLPLPVRLAPSREQVRIVEAFESYFTRLDAAEATLERAKRNLERYRASVLQAAVEGRLVPSTTRSDSPGHSDLPPGWNWKPLGALLSEPLRNGHSSRRSTDGNGVRTLTLTAVTYGDFSDRNTKLTVADPERVEDLWLEPGDLLIERSNTRELVGTTRLFQGPRRWAIFPDLLIRARLQRGVSPRFVEAVLSAAKCRKYFMEQARGIAGSMPKISQETIEAAPIPVPPEHEQVRIVAELDKQTSSAEHCLAALSEVRKRLVRTRQAILGSAFVGRLVDQDPTDEPASVLPERIRAKRAKAASSTETPRRRGRPRKAVKQ